MAAGAGVPHWLRRWTIESTLTLAKTDFYANIGLHAGFGLGKDVHGETEWTARQLYVIRDCVNSGCRRFYDAYNWTFKRPFHTAKLVSGFRTLELPDDFGGLEGGIHVSDSNSSSFLEVKLVNPGSVEQMYSEAPDSTGRPEMVSLRQLKGTTGTRADRQEIFVWPEADAAYTLKFQYYLQAGALEDDSPYAYGGTKHSETIMAACLSVLEEKYNGVVNGPHAMAFARGLQVSVHKNQNERPRDLGYNGDSSDLSGSAWTNYTAVTYNGVDNTG